MSGQSAIVAGVGMTKFVAPSASPSYVALGTEALHSALADAGISYNLVEQAYAGFVYGDSTAGQRVLYEVGMTGIPVVNVNNNCSTGSTALFLARQAVQSGVVACALALGFEQMRPGALGAVFPDLPSPLDRFMDVLKERFGAEADGVPPAVLQFGGAGVEYQQRYGAKDELFAAVRSKASLHARHNDKAIFRKPVTADDVMASPVLFRSLRRLAACAPSCGAAAAIVCSPEFARRHGITDGVIIAAQAMTTDTPETFAGASPISVVGYDMSRRAAAQVYETAGIGPQDVSVVELHDCFATNEVISYEALGLCGEGEASRFVFDGDNTYGGKVVTNPSGGLLSKGHPLGATGLAQCTELVQQLRGQCGARQVPGARVALQHNIGLGGACVVTLYKSAGRT